MPFNIEELGLSASIECPLSHRLLSLWIEKAAKELKEFLEVLEEECSYSIN
jgi:hypothetical protein